MALTERQARFVAEYLVDLNATQAASRAGYKDPNIGRQLITKNNVSEAIQKAIQKRSQRTEITQDMILKELANIAFANGTDFAKVVCREVPTTTVDEDGNLQTVTKLTQLVEIAKIQSTEASNKIEGIYTSDERLKKIVMNKALPQSRSEQEIAGYRDVLATIHENYDYIPVRPSFILQLHRDLYKFSGKSIGGNYKNSDNVIAEEDEQGNKFIRFQPVPAWETPTAIDAICSAYDDIQNEDVPEYDGEYPTDYKTLEKIISKISKT